VVLVAIPTALAAGKYKPFVGTVEPDGMKFVADTDRPAVKLVTDTFFVVLLCTIGNTSVPANGVVAPVNADIFVLAIFIK